MADAIPPIGYLACPHCGNAEDSDTKFHDTRHEDDRILCDLACPGCEREWTVVYCPSHFLVPGDYRPRPFLRVLDVLAGLQTLN